MNLAEFFKHDFNKGDFNLYDKNGKLIFWETSDKFWAIYERDENGNKTFYEDSNKLWVRYECNKDGNTTFHEDSNKYWIRYERDENGKITFWENSYEETYGTPKSQEIEMTVKELQDLISQQKGKNIKLKIKE